VKKSYAIINAFPSQRTWTIGKGISCSLTDTTSRQLPQRPPRISFQEEMAVDESSIHSAPEEFHDPSPHDGMTDNDGSDSDFDNRIIPPHPTKNPPVKSVPRDPSKTCLP
jgi:hypothetical protein